MSPGRELVTDPGGRWAVYLGSGSGPHSATVQRVRLGGSEVEAALAAIRSFLRERSRGGAEWELGGSCTPADLVTRLLELGLRRDAEEPFATGMVLRGPLGGMAPPEVTTRRVTSLEELGLAREIQRAAFGIDDEEFGLEQARADFEAEGVTGATFLAFVDGEAVSAAYASYTPLGLLLFGGATLPAFRGPRRLSRARRGAGRGGGRTQHPGARHARGPHVAADPGAPGFRAGGAHRPADRRARLIVSACRRAARAPSRPLGAWSRSRRGSSRSRCRRPGRRR